MGSNSAPAFVDTGRDGDMDLVIKRQEDDLSFYFYYENTGSASNASYTRREGTLNPFDRVAAEGDYSAPAFVDTDNDGDMDLVIGRGKGDLKFYYENTGSASNPLTREERVRSTRLMGSLWGIHSAPAFVDTDNDGDMDLVIGRYRVISSSTTRIRAARATLLTRERGCAQPV